MCVCDTEEEIMDDIKEVLKEEDFKALLDQTRDSMNLVFFSDLVEFLDGTPCLGSSSLYDIPRFYYLNEEQRKQLLKANKDLFKKKISILQFFKYYYHMSLPKRVNTFINTDPTYKEFKEHVKNLKSFMKNKYGINLNFID